MWYALAAIVAISLVYAATRHERMLPILIHAGRVFLWIVGFMLLVFLVMQFISWRTCLTPGPLGERLRVDADCVMQQPSP